MMKSVIVLAAVLAAAVLPQAFGQEEGRELHGCHSFKCPPFSTVKEGTKCLDSFRDCLCHPGYKPFNRTCIPCPFKPICENVCHHVKEEVCRPVCEEVCNKHGCRKVCKKECKFVLRKVCRKVCKRKRVCECDFKCPLNSAPRRGTQCLDTIGDCKCKDGYRMVNGECVPKCHYRCPRKSVFIGHSDDCPDNFDHCRCKEGYEKKDGRCVKCDKHCFEKCIFGKDGKKCKQVCIPRCDDQFVCPFKCPANSFQITKARCARDMRDCRCKHGYVVKHDKCVRV